MPSEYDLDDSSNLSSKNHRNQEPTREYFEDFEQSDDLDSTAYDVVEKTPHGSKQHYSKSGRLNKRDGQDLVENGALFGMSEALTSGMDSAADSLQGTMDYGSSIWLLAIKLLLFSGLKLFTLFIRSNGIPLTTKFFRTIFMRK